MARRFTGHLLCSGATPGLTNAFVVVDKRLTQKRRANSILVEASEDIPLIKVLLFTYRRAHATSIRKWAVDLKNKHTVRASPSSPPPQVFA